MAHILLKEAGYDIIEFNASEVRSQKSNKESSDNVIPMTFLNERIMLAQPFAFLNCRNSCIAHCEPVLWLWRG